MLLNIKVEQKLKFGDKMNISQEGIALIKKFEGCRLEAYQDSVGIWTIAYGTIKDVKEGDKINQD